MKNISKNNFDREYLRRCKYSSPESKLQWLAAALEFSQAKKKIIVRTKSR